jgi:alpha-beta hydrolase superfamily lysophospholipase
MALAHVGERQLRSPPLWRWRRRRAYLRVGFLLLLAVAVGAVALSVSCSAAEAKSSPLGGSRPAERGSAGAPASGGASSEGRGSDRVSSFRALKSKIASASGGDSGSSLAASVAAAFSSLFARQPSLLLWLSVSLVSFLLLALLYLFLSAPSRGVTLATYKFHHEGFAALPSFCAAFPAPHVPFSYFLKSSLDATALAAIKRFNDQQHASESASGTLPALHGAQSLFAMVTAPLLHQFQHSALLLKKGTLLTARTPSRVLRTYIAQLPQQHQRADVPSSVAASASAAPADAAAASGSASSSGSEDADGSHTPRDFASSDSSVSGVLLWLPELGQHAGHNLALAERLAGMRIAMASLDFEGFGESEGERGVVRSCVHLVEDLLVFCRTLRRIFPEPIPLFVGGTGLGAALALLLSVEAPRRFAGLLLFSPTLELSLTSTHRALLSVCAAVRPRARFPSLRLFSTDALSRNLAIVEHLEGDRFYVPPQRWDVGTNAQLTRLVHLAYEAVPALSVPFILQAGVRDLIGAMNGTRRLATASARVPPLSKKLYLHANAWHDLLHEAEAETAVDHAVDWIAERMRHRAVAASLD